MKQLFLVLTILFLPLAVFAEDLKTGSDFLISLSALWSDLNILERIVGVIWGLVPLFSLMVAMTNTPDKYSWWGKYAYPILELLALTVFKAKQQPGDSEAIKSFR